MERKLSRIKADEKTDEEAIHFGSLVETKKVVTVVFKDGEQLRGRIRYYDRYCFSLKTEPLGLNVFTRKSSVRTILEE
jgi:sRNA-binding regulator protein Hfq